MKRNAVRHLPLLLVTIALWGWILANWRDVLRSWIDALRDGKADILSRHISGVVYLWLMSGTTIIGGGSPGSAPTDWTIQSFRERCGGPASTCPVAQGTGDFNGDGKVDILWRHTSGAL